MLKELVVNYDRRSKRASVSINTLDVVKETEKTIRVSTCSLYLSVIRKAELNTLLEAHFGYTYVCFFTDGSMVESLLDLVAQHIESKIGYLEEEMDKYKCIHTQLTERGIE